MRRAFPDFDPVEISLLHGLGQMDGATRGLRGRYHLLFGVDLVAKKRGVPLLRGGRNRHEGLKHGQELSSAASAPR
jgi:hypothetical protein